MSPYEVKLPDELPPEVLKALLERAQREGRRHRVVTAEERAEKVKIKARRKAERDRKRDQRRKNRR